MDWSRYESESEAGWDIKKDNPIGIGVGVEGGREERRREREKR